MVATAIAEHHPAYAADVWSSYSWNHEQEFWTYLVQEYARYYPRYVEECWAYAASDVARRYERPVVRERWAHNPYAQSEHVYTPDPAVLPQTEAESTDRVHAGVPGPMDEEKTAVGVRPVDMGTEVDVGEKLDRVQSDDEVTRDHADGDEILYVDVDESSGLQPLDVCHIIPGNVSTPKERRNRGVRKGHKGDTGVKADARGETHDAGRSLQSSAGPPMAAETRVLPGVEDSVQVGGRNGAQAGRFDSHEPTRISSDVPTNKSYEVETIPPRPVSTRSTQGPNKWTPWRARKAGKIAQEVTDNQDNGTTAQRGDEANPAGQEYIHKVDKEGGRGRSDGASGAEQSSAGDNRAPAQACGDTAPVAGPDGTVYDGQSKPRRSHGDGSRDDSTLRTPVKKNRKYMQELCARADTKTKGPSTTQVEAPTHVRAGTHGPKTQVNDATPAPSDTKNKNAKEGKPPVTTQDEPPTAAKKPLHLAVGKSSKASTAQEYRTLPLHAKNVAGNIDMDKVQKMADRNKHPLAARLRELIARCRDPSYYTPMNKEDIDSAKPTKLSHEDIKRFMEIRQLRKVEYAFVKAVLTAYCVTEEKVPQDGTKFYTGATLPTMSAVTKRRRVIAWPKWNNGLSTYQSEIDLVNLRDDLMQGRPGDYAACADLIMSFSQLATSEDVQAFHCIKDEDGQWYAFTVAVMGEDYVPELMEVITNVLATCDQSRKVREEVDTNVLRTKTHIDNVRFLHPNPFIVNEAVQRFVSNCKDVGALVNDDPLIQPHTFGTSFGVVHDYHEAVVALSEKHLRKLKQAHEDIRNPTLNVRRVCEIFGLLFFCSTVLAVKLAKFYFPLKWYRRIAHDFERGFRGKEQAPFHLASKVTPWKSLLPSFDSWFEKLLENKPASHVVPDPTVTLFCDASRSGCGGVYIDGVDPTFRQYGEGFTRHEFSELWDEKDLPKAIARLETRAATKTIRFFRKLLEGKTVHMFIDNTSLEGALAKTYSKSFALNGELLELINEMERSGAKFIVEYVQSKDNLADRPSRIGRLGQAS